MCFALIFVPGCGNAFPAVPIIAATVFINWDEYYARGRNAYSDAENLCEVCFMVHLIG